MPGKANLESSDFVTNTALYRQITAADTDDMASIDALAETIDLAFTESKSTVEPVLQGKTTQLNTGVLMLGDATSITLKFYANMGLSPGVETTAVMNGDLSATLGADRWALLHEETVTANKVIQLQGIPASEIKVIATAIATTTGSVVLTYQRSE